MPLETIYVVRHGFRSSWSVDHTTGVYSASIPSPTGIAVDPALTAHGVDQSRQLAQHLMTIDPPVEVVYSSPYYRCLQTITPFVELQQQQQRHAHSHGESTSTGSGSDSGPPPSAATMIRPEHGICEWFGSAPFEHPGPASPSVLKSLFPAFDESYVSAQYPPKRGETLAQLQARLTATMQSIIDRCDAEDRRAVVLCTHAAVVIMLGRILTGDFPETVDTDDFHAFTCGLSVYRRKLDNRDQGRRGKGELPDKEPNPSAVAVGGWSCEANSDCSFLAGGEERGWKFVGDEEFPDTGSMSQATSTSESKL
ncbi:histidine phosphatase superfamily [Trichoderma sp. SZMC 28012]